VAHHKHPNQRLDFEKRYNFQQLCGETDERSGSGKIVT